MYWVVPFNFIAYRVPRAGFNLEPGTINEFVHPCVFRQLAAAKLTDKQSGKGSIVGTVENTSLRSSTDLRVACAAGGAYVGACFAQAFFKVISLLTVLIKFYDVR